MTRRRIALLPRLGLRPSVGEVVVARLAEAIARTEAADSAGAAPGHDGPFARVVALDAGCGRRSALLTFRPRLRRLVGVDLHRPPAGTLAQFDAFEAADLCRDGDAFPAETFDVVLSSFTVEHFADPAAAFANLARWTRRGGTLVLSTVNRRHPLVGLYLSLPPAIQRPLQQTVKASPADAHPLIGRCNDPAALRRALEAAGFEDVRVVTVPNLARSWSRHLASFGLGLLGDLAAQPLASRRATIVADARRPR